MSHWSSPAPASPARRWAGSRATSVAAAGLILFAPASWVKPPTVGRWPGVRRRTAWYAQRRRGCRRDLDRDRRSRRDRDFAVCQREPRSGVCGVAVTLTVVLGYAGFELSGRVFSTARGARPHAATRRRSRSGSRFLVRWQGAVARDACRLVSIRSAPAVREPVRSGRRGSARLAVCSFVAAPDVVADVGRDELRAGADEVGRRWFVVRGGPAGRCMLLRSGARNRRSRGRRGRVGGGDARIAPVELRVDVFDLPRGGVDRRCRTAAAAIAMAAVLLCRRHRATVASSAGSAGGGWRHSRRAARRGDLLARPADRRSADSAARES